MHGRKLKIETELNFRFCQIRNQIRMHISFQFDTKQFRFYVSLFSYQSDSKSDTVFFQYLLDTKYFVSKLSLVRFKLRRIFCSMGVSGKLETNQFISKWPFSNLNQEYSLCNIGQLLDSLIHSYISLQIQTSHQQCNTYNQQIILQLDFQVSNACQ